MESAEPAKTALRVVFTAYGSWLMDFKLSHEIVFSLAKRDESAEPPVAVAVSAFRIHYLQQKFLLSVGSGGEALFVFISVHSWF